jgi:hypothetical protein
MTGNDLIVAAAWTIFTVALTAVCIRLRPAHAAQATAAVA